MKTNLLNFNQQQLVEFFAELDEPAYRATQLIKWIHGEGIVDFSAMTNFSKILRAKLADVACIELPKVLHQHVAADSTRKWLIQLESGNAIETVYIPDVDRGTLCVSSQIGCALNCTFCATAQQGFNRNLSLGEIIGQVWLAVRELAKLDPAQEQYSTKLTNVVMMGMGEPLLNYNAVVGAMDLMMSDYAYNLSKYRVTLSTSGVVPAMWDLAKDSQASLAVSLHAPNDELRDILVPINKKYPLKELLTACREYFPKQSKRKVTFEYVMLKDVNDSIDHARQLAKCLSDIPSKLNLIPFNPFPNAQYVCPDRDVIVRFQNYMINAGFNTIVRRTRGDDINAACGQLAGDFKDKTRRRERLLSAVRP